MPYADPIKSREYHTRKSREWYQKYPEKRAKIARKHHQTDAGKRTKRKCNLKAIGWTLEGFEKALIGQAYKCAICRAPLDVDGIKGKNKPCADHDHETNVAREVLCGACNFLLGQAQDDIEILKRAIAYLRKHKNAKKKDC